jgi:hypothetical protein
LPRPEEEVVVLFGSAWVNWSALGKILLVALIAGVGVVLVFGVLLLFAQRAQSSKSSAGRAVNYAISGICAAVCIGVVVVGIIAMKDKPASKAKAAHKSNTKSAQLAPVAPPPGRLTFHV